LVTVRRVINAGAVRRDPGAILGAEKRALLADNLGLTVIGQHLPAHGTISVGIGLFPVQRIPFVSEQ
jgi:hypothetical protein